MDLFYNLNINFSIENVLFTVPNIARERFMAPVPKHSHGNDSYELHYIASGYGSAWINGKIYKLTPDTLYITGPHIEHEQIPYIDNPMTEYSVFFTILKNTEEPTCLDAFIDTPFWIGESGAALYSILQDIFKELQKQQIGYLTQTSSLLQQAVILLIRNYQTPRPGKIPSVSAGNLYESRAFLVDKAFLYEYRDISLAGLAECLGLSERQTERFLKDYYGKTFAQKRADARMAAACIFLKSPEPDLFEIAEKTGYTSLDYFTNAFKKYFNMTPKQYIRLSEKTALYQKYKEQDLRFS